MKHFPDALFWDTDPNLLDLDKHGAYIIGRVLDYGNLENWVKLKSLYSDERILSETKKMRDLHPKTLSFLSLYFNIPKTEFRCYTHAQSIKTHYPF